MPATVIVTGLAQIQRDLAKSGKQVSYAMNAGLRESAEPVARLAESYSLQPNRIRRMNRSPQWAKVRIGIFRGGVYIVPKERGVRHADDPKRRPNLVELMLGRSFDPALEQGAPIVERNVSRLLGEVTSQVGI